MYNKEVERAFCGLCYLRDGFQSEVPKKIHLSRTLAENGNPQTAPQFMSHLFVAVGLVPPAPDEDLREFREKRKPSRARGQYTVPAQSEPYWQLYPVSSALWKLMGYQPPLGRVIAPAVVRNLSEVDISYELRTTLVDVHVRMVKAIRTTMGYLPHETAAYRDPSGEDDRKDQSKDRSSES